MNINSLNRCNANLSTTDNLLITSFRLQNHSPRRGIQYAWRYKMLKKWHFSHMMINQYLSHLNRADYKTYPTFDVLGTQFEMARSKANENLHKLSPMLYDTLVHLELMPYRELATPEDVKAAVQGVEQLIIDATERAYRRSQDDAKQREHYSGKKKSIR